MAQYTGLLGDRSHFQRNDYGLHEAEQGPYVDVVPAPGTRDVTTVPITPVVGTGAATPVPTTPVWSGFDPSTASLSSMYPYLGPTQNLLSTFEGRPQELWEAAQWSALGDRAFIPQFQRTIGQGFMPAYGGYLLGGAEEGSGTFADYLSNLNRTTSAGTAAMPGVTQGVSQAANWAQAVEAARRLDPTYTAQRTLGENGTTPDFGRMTAIQGALQNDPRSTSVAMALSAMGGGRGMLGQAKQRALGNLFDIYSARATAAGRPETGFISYLDSLGTIPR